MYDVLFFLIGLGLIGLGVWYLYKDKFRVSLILIGFGLMGAGWLWPPGFCFGIVSGWRLLGIWKERGDGHYW